MAAIFVKYCYTTGSGLFWLMSKYTLFGLLSARGKLIVKQDYWRPRLIPQAQNV